MLSTLPPPPSERAVPRLAAHARRRTDPIDGRALLLYPEGVLELEETAAATLDLCDGRPVGEIVIALAESYTAAPEEIHRDVVHYLQTMAAKGLLRIEDPEA